MSESLGSHVARFAYATVLGLAAPLYALRVLWRGRREPLYAENLGERNPWRISMAMPYFSFALLRTRKVIH